MTGKKARYWASLILVLTFVIGLFTPAVVTSARTATGLTDINDHWAKDKITEWVQKGLVSGYTDGTFKPDKSITRAEFMTLVNKALGFSEKAAIGFSDVAAKDWFYEEVAKAVKAGYISGYQDGTVKPNQEISRQEAAVALCKALNLELQDNVAQFTDIDTIPNWSKPYISALAAKGYMGGYPDGTFRPERHITRAETVTMLDNALEALTISYNEAGVYGPEEGIETVSQDVAINVPGVTLRNMVIEGNLYLNEGIGEGDVTLDNVTVKGITTVRGGGKDSIHLVNFICEEVIVIKVGGKVRIIASGSTDVSELKLQSGAHIEGKGFATVTILKEGEDVVLDGDFEEVIIDADVKVEVLEGSTIHNLEINSRSKVDLASDATVKDLIIEAAATITGKGTIENAEINADGAELEMEPKKYELAEGVTAEIAGKEVKEEEKKSSGGGGGGGGSSLSKVSAIRITTDPSDVMALPNNAEVKVTLSTSTSGTNIYYTSDGSTPTSFSKLYDGPFTVTAPGDEGGKVTVKAIGIRSGYRNSNVATIEIIFRAKEVVEPGKAVLYAKVSGPGMPTSEVAAEVDGEKLQNFVLYFDDTELASTENGKVIVATAALDDKIRLKVESGNETYVRDNLKINFVDFDEDFLK